MTEQGTQDVLGVQRRILAREVFNPEFAKKAINVSSDLFEGQPSHQHLHSAIREYYAQDTKSPSKSVLGVFVDQKLDRLNASPEMRAQVHLALGEAYELPSATEKAFDSGIEDYMLTTRMTDELKKTIARGITPDAVRDLIEATGRLAQETSVSSVVGPVNFMDKSQRQAQADKLRALNTNIMSTGSPVWDRMTGGGLAKGELGAIGASSGHGKTMHMVSLAVAYILSGRNIAYIALEELDSRMFLRFFRVVIGKLADAGHIDKSAVEHIVSIDALPDVVGSGSFDKILDTYTNKGHKTGSLYFSRYAPHELTVDALGALMRGLTVTDGVELDVMFVDYPDLLSYGENKESAERGRLLYEHLRAIAQANNVVGWVATQLNRTSHMTSLKTEAHVEGSYSKQNSLEFLGIVNSSPEEYSHGFSRMYIAKARNTKNKGSVHVLKVDSTTSAVVEPTPHDLLKHGALSLELAPDDTAGATKRKPRTEDNKASLEHIQTTFNQQEEAK